MRKKNETIAFRADHELLKVIDIQREKFGISRGVWVRGIIITWLNQIQLASQQNDRNSAQLTEIQTQLNVIIRNQAKSLFLELTSLGSMSIEDARALVQRHFALEKE